MAEQITNKRFSTLGARFTSTVSVALVLLMLGLGLMAAVLGQGVHQELKRNIGFTVRLQNTCSDIEKNDLRAFLNTHPGIASTVFLSADSILNQEKEYLGETIADGLDENPYLPEFEILLAGPYTNPDSVVALTTACASFPGVEDVASETAIIEGVDRFLHKISLVSVGAAIILLIIAIALIGNTVSLSVYSRRHAIRTMQLVGASNSFIIKPFILAALVSAIIGSAAAAAACAFLRVYAADYDPVVESLLPWNYMTLIFIVLLTAGVALCCGTTYISVWRTLKSKKNFT